MKQFYMVSVAAFDGEVFDSVEMTVEGVNVAVEEYPT